MTKTLVWNKFDYPQEVIGANGVQDRQLAPSVNGMRKLYCIAVPTARLDNQDYIESTSNTRITDINIVIDSKDFYRYDIKTDIEAYELVAENFNMDGEDMNTGRYLIMAVGSQPADIMYSNYPDRSCSRLMREKISPSGLEAHYLLTVDCCSSLQGKRRPHLTLMTHHPLSLYNHPRL